MMLGPVQLYSPLSPPILCTCVVACCCCASRWPQHLTLLTVAAKLGRTNCLKVLLDFGAGINMQCRASMFTATLMAAYSGRQECLRYLLQHGGDPDIPNKCVQVWLWEECRQPSADGCVCVCVCVCVCCCVRVRGCMRWWCGGRRYKEDALTAAQKARPRRDVCAAMIERFKAGLPISASAMASAMPGRG